MNGSTDTISPEIIALLEKELPSWFTRRQAVKHLNGLFTYATLSNYQLRRIGPPTFRMGRVICYTKTTFIQWLRDYFGSMEVTYEPGFGRRIRKVSQDNQQE